MPGLYSQWLRLWGSRVGANVSWHYDVMIKDRAHLQIGDDAKIKPCTVLSSHKIENNTVTVSVLVIPSQSQIEGIREI